MVVGRNRQSNGSKAGRLKPFPPHRSNICSLYSSYIITTMCFILCLPMGRAVLGSEINDTQDFLLRASRNESRTVYNGHPMLLTSVGILHRKTHQTKPRNYHISPSVSPKPDFVHNSITTYLIDAITTEQVPPSRGRRRGEHIHHAPVIDKTQNARGERESTSSEQSEKTPSHTQHLNLYNPTHHRNAFQSHENQNSVSSPYLIQPYLSNEYVNTGLLEPTIVSREDHSTPLRPIISQHPQASSPRTSNGRIPLRNPTSNKTLDNTPLYNTPSDNTPLDNIPSDSIPSLRTPITNIQDHRSVLEPPISKAAKHLRQKRSHEPSGQLTPYTESTQLIHHNQHPNQSHRPWTIPGDRHSGYKGRQSRYSQSNPAHNNMGPNVYKPDLINEYGHPALQNIHPYRNNAYNNLYPSRDQWHRNMQLQYNIDTYRRPTAHPPPTYTSTTNPWIQYQQRRDKPTLDTKHKPSMFQFHGAPSNLLPYNHNNNNNINLYYDYNQNKPYDDNGDNVYYNTDWNSNNGRYTDNTQHPVRLPEWQIHSMANNSTPPSKQYQQYHGQNGQYNRQYIPNIHQHPPSNRLSPLVRQTPRITQYHPSSNIHNVKGQITPNILSPLVRKSPRNPYQRFHHFSKHGPLRNLTLSPEPLHKYYNKYETFRPGNHYPGQKIPDHPIPYIKQSDNHIHNTQILYDTHQHPFMNNQRSMGVYSTGLSNPQNGFLQTQYRTNNMRRPSANQNIPIPPSLKRDRKPYTYFKDPISPSRINQKYPPRLSPRPPSHITHERYWDNNTPPPKVKNRNPWARHNLIDTTPKTFGHRRIYDEENRYRITNDYHIQGPPQSGNQFLSHLPPKAGTRDSYRQHQRNRQYQQQNGNHPNYLHKQHQRGYIQNHPQHHRLLQSQKQPQSKRHRQQHRRNYQQNRQQSYRVNRDFDRDVKSLEDNRILPRDQYNPIKTFRPNTRNPYTDYSNKDRNHHLETHTNHDESPGLPPTHINKHNTHRDVHKDTTRPIKNMIDEPVLQYADCSNRLTKYSKRCRHRDRTYEKTTFLQDNHQKNYSLKTNQNQFQNPSHQQRFNTKTKTQRKLRPKNKNMAEDLPSNDYGLTSVKLSPLDRAKLLGKYRENLMRHRVVEQQDQTWSHRFVYRIGNDQDRVTPRSNDFNPVLTMTTSTESTWRPITFIPVTTIPTTHFTWAPTPYHSFTRNIPPPSSVLSPLSSTPPTILSSTPPLPTMTSTRTTSSSTTTTTTTATTTTKAASIIPTTIPPPFPRLQHTTQWNQRVVSPEDLNSREISQQCGIMGRPFIIGGQRSRPGRWPWQASLQIIASLTPWHRCGGVLVHPKWILTAAHCMEGSFYGNKDNWRIVMADYDLDLVSGNEVYRSIIKIVSHPDYQRASNFPNDVALLEMDSPVDLTAGTVRTACLPGQQDDRWSGWEDGEEGGSQCWMSGWGETRDQDTETNTMNEVPAEIVTLSECKVMWSRVDIDVLDSQVCVGHGQTGACYGDSGGPLMCERGGRFYVTGVMSWLISNCSAPNYPNVFTRLTSYMGWLEAQIDLS